MEAEPGTTMRNVRLYKVGTRIIIEIDGAGEYLDQAILQMLTSCMGRPVEKMVLDLEQVDERSDSMPVEREQYAASMIITDGPYTGMTANQALKQYGEQALAELYGYLQRINDPEKKRIIGKTCKQYMSEVLSEKKYSVKDEKDIEKMIRILSTLINETRLAQMFSYRNLNEFLEYASLQEKKLAFEGIIDHLTQRGRQ